MGLPIRLMFEQALRVEAMLVRLVRMRLVCDSLVTEERGSIIQLLSVSESGWEAFSSSGSMLNFWRSSSRQPEHGLQPPTATGAGELLHFGLPAIWLTYVECQCQ